MHLKQIIDWKIVFQNLELVSILSCINLKKAWPAKRRVLVLPWNLEVTLGKPMHIGVPLFLSSHADSDILHPYWRPADEK